LRRPRKVRSATTEKSGRALTFEAVLAPGGNSDVQVCEGPDNGFASAPTRCEAAPGRGPPRTAPAGNGRLTCSDVRPTSAGRSSRGGGPPATPGIGRPCPRWAGLGAGRPRGNLRLRDSVHLPGSVSGTPPPREGHLLRRVPAALG
jgi:hypothetical protein